MKLQQQIEADTLCTAAVWPSSSFFWGYLICFTKSMNKKHPSVQELCFYMFLHAEKYFKMCPPVHFFDFEIFMHIKLPCRILLFCSSRRFTEAASF